MCVEVEVPAPAAETAEVEVQNCATAEKEVCLPSQSVSCSPRTIRSCLTVPKRVCTEIEIETTKLECASKDTEVKSVKRNYREKICVLTALVLCCRPA